jgi:hypothetical protein
MAVTMAHGANEYASEHAVGQSVGAVRAAYAELLNLPPDQRVPARVGGKEVPDTYILEDGDRLEFIQKSGQKGDS